MHRLIITTGTLDSDNESASMESAAEDSESDNDTDSMEPSDYTQNSTEEKEEEVSVPRPMPKRDLGLPELFALSLKTYPGVGSGPYYHDDVATWTWALDTLLACIPVANNLKWCVQAVQKINNDINWWMDIYRIQDHDSFKVFARSIQHPHEWLSKSTLCTSVPEHLQKMPNPSFLAFESAPENDQLELELHLFKITKAIAKQQIINELLP